MGSRTIYFCDWCLVDSPQMGVIPNDWKVIVPEHSSNREHLCVGCVAALREAYDSAKANRRALGERTNAARNK